MIIQYDIINNYYHPHRNDAEMMDAAKKLREAVNKYLTDQINMSFLGIGDDNICNTARL